MGKLAEMRMSLWGYGFGTHGWVSGVRCCNSLAPSSQTLLGALLQKRNTGNMQHHTDSLFAYCHQQ